jgi:diguanylate cyclase (GGDEF)-like protein
MYSSHIHALIVEDSPTQAEQLRYLLERQNYTVTIAANGQEALKAAKKRRPDIIISDIIIPKMDGYQLCQAIKSDSNLRDIPVILVTSLSGMQDVVKALDSGADNFIRKPYEEKYLLSRIDYLLTNRRLRRDQKVQLGMEIHLLGQKHFITAERQQILDMLISIYEEAIRMNEELGLRQEQLNQSHLLLNGLYRIAEGLNRATSEQEVVMHAVARALELPSIESCWIWLREDSGDYRLAAAENLSPLFQQPETSDHHCLCQRKLEAGEMTTVLDIEACERLRSAESSEGGHHGSVPLRVNDTRLGILNLVRKDGKPFSEDERKTLLGIGNQIAVALMRAQLHDRLETLVEQRTAALTAEIAARKAQEAKILRLNRIHAVLSGINTAIVHIQERAALFQEACRIATELGQFKMAWVGLVNEAPLGVEVVAWAGINPGSPEEIAAPLLSELPESREIFARIMRGEPVIVNDIATDPLLAPWREEAQRSGFGSVAVFPLCSEQGTRSVIGLYAAEPRFFDQDELLLLKEMTGDVNYALDNIEKNERLNYLAFYDAVTGLPNRMQFDSGLNRILSWARQQEKKVALVVLDLDRFAMINDSLGYAKGDCLLRQVGKRLKDALADDEFLARSGSDEFALALAMDEEADILRSVDAVVHSTLAEPFEIEGKSVRITAKAGAAIFPSDAGDAESLLKNAEAALAKARQANERFLFYAPAMNARVAEVIAIENKLLKALENREFVLHYQPKLNLKASRISGVEALIRWQDPQRGLVPPGLFIPLLEETGMIREVGRWVLEEAVNQHRLWLEKGYGPIPIAVNVSPLQLRDGDFGPEVKAILSKHQLEGCIEMEITETTIMQAVEEKIDMLKSLQKQDVKISIDDFGTGYSSLSYLTRLPINRLKIDRAFISDMTQSPNSLSVVSSIISLARSLDLGVVAEGVETEDQLNLLKLLKCDEIQGYVFARPLPLDEFESFVERSFIPPCSEPKHRQKS